MVRNTIKRPTVAIAFDALLATPAPHERSGPGDPLPGAREFLCVLRDAGWHIVILTTEMSTREAKHWLRKHDLFLMVDTVTAMLPGDLKAIIHPLAIRFSGPYDDVLVQLENLRPWWEKS